MQKIKLTRGLVAVVEDVDYSSIIDITWCAFPGCNTFYAYNRDIGLMHRFILGIKDRKIKIDHRDMNGLNNLRSNLRIASDRQNFANRGVSKNNTSGYKGVYWHNQNKKWMAEICFDYKLYFLGLFDTAIEAALEYDEAAKIFHGEFAKPNF